MCKKTDTVQDILIKTINNKLEWKSIGGRNENVRNYYCHDIGVSEYDSVSLCVSDSSSYLFVKFSNGTDMVCRAWFGENYETEIDEILIQVLSKYVELNGYCLELKEVVECDFRGEEIAPSYIWDLILETSHNKLKWEKVEISEEEFLFPDELELKKYTGHATDITKFQMTRYRYDELETYILYHFRYDNSYISGYACVLEHKGEDDEFSVYADVNRDIESGPKAILYKLYDLIIEYLHKDSYSQVVLFSERIKEIREYAGLRKNCLTFYEVREFFGDFNLNLNQINSIIEVLESYNIDVLRIMDDDDIMEIQQPVEAKSSPANKYVTEEERIAARKESQKKYRRKINKENKFMTDKIMDVANSDPYEKYSDDIEFLHDILKY